MNVRAARTGRPIAKKARLRRRPDYEEGMSCPMNALPRSCDPEQGTTRAVSGVRHSAFGVAFVLLPGFDMLALIAGMEPFRVAGRQGGRGAFRLRLLSADRAPVLSAQGIAMPVDGGLSDDAAADLTLVVGGETAEADLPSVLTGHLRRIWRQGRQVGAVHGGIFALARAGILGGHRFAAHRDHLPILATQWPELTPVANLFCLDRRIVTCAGGIAMADLSLRLIHDSAGQAVAHDAMHACLVTSPRGEATPQASPVAQRVQSRNPSLRRAVQWIEQNFADPDCLPKAVSVAGTSARQLQRLFRIHLGLRPIQYLTEVRLNQARILLAQTELPVQDVALACGYNSLGTFTKVFRERFGMSPSRYSPFALHRQGLGRR